MTIDYQPIIQAVLEAALTAAAGTAVWAIKQVGAHFAAQANTTQQSNFDLALKKSLSTAFNTFASRLQEYGSAHPETKTLILQTAGQTLLQTFPKTSAAVGVKTIADATTALVRVYNTLPAIKPSAP